MRQQGMSNAQPVPAPTRGSGLAFAGSLLLLAPMAMFVLTLWLTDGAPLRPIGLDVETALGLVLPESAR
jgi:hypothetical protein